MKRLPALILLSALSLGPAVARGQGGRAPRPIAVAEAQAPVAAEPETAPSAAEHRILFVLDKPNDAFAERIRGELAGLGFVVEVSEAWRVMMQQRHQPTALILTRQDVPILDRSVYASAEGLARGGYVLADADGEPEVILIATGSEVALAIGAYEELRSDGVQARVVSLPSWYLFDLQEDDYRESVLPRAVQARVAVEQGSTLGWDRYVGPQGQIVGMHTFGASAPLKEVQRKFGFTPERVAEAAKELLK